METSFIKYRDRTGVDSESDSEIIDNSLTDESCAPTKTPLKKNQTVFVPESDETSTDDEDVSEANIFKSVTRRSSVHQHVIVSSDDDRIKRGSICKQSNSINNVVLSSSGDEDEVSPEIMPRRRPKTSSRSSESFIGRKTKKRMFLIDSDTENSIIIENDRNRKLKCLKDTPAKIDKDLRKSVLDIKNMSIQSNDTIQIDDDEQSSYNDNGSDDNEQSSNNDNGSDDNEQSSNNDNGSDDNEQSSNNDNGCDDDEQSSGKANGSDDDNEKENSDTNCESNDEENINVDKYLQHKQSSISAQTSEDEKLSDNDTKTRKNDKENSDYKQSSSAENVNNNVENKYRQTKDDNRKERKIDHNLSEENDESYKSDNHTQYSSEDEGPDEDQMVMSRATRMSIMGFLPKENESDDSDYLQSDDGNTTSRGSSLDNLKDPLPTSVNKTPEKVTKLRDTSRLSCSPIQRPLHEITNEINNSISDTIKSSPDICNLTRSESYSPKNKVLNKITENEVKTQEDVIDDDVTIVDTKPEIIALSSDDEDEVKDEKKSPLMKIKTKTEEPSIKKDNSIKQYLVPASYPNQVVYVKKNVRENELSKLNGLKEDLQNIRYLLEHMDVNTLPDGGLKLIERLTALEAEVRRQGDKVANMVVEPDQPTFEDVAKDGFDKENKGLSWDDLKKASNAVQPRMFGKQAMSTHMAERNLILDRLRDLYESLASRPPENELSAQPSGLKSELMLHQQHALAWLHWRETQRPKGGILADDMGLGKTITMISLIVSDKGKNIDHDDGDDDGKGRSRLCRGGTLVVCPASLMQQWAGEVTLHCRPHALSVCLHHGATRATQPHRLATYDLVVTTYNILQRESEKSGVLTRVRWRRVILDEAHVVRNHKSSTSLGVCSLAAAARWALTGTPLHNKDLDLFALLKFLRCTPFDDLAMWKKWIDNKSLGGQERLGTIMRCIMLRRTKQLLQEKGQLTCLPQRSVHKCDVTLSKEEMTVYQKVLVFSKTLFAQFLHQRAERTGDVPKGSDSEYHKMHKKMIALQGTKPVKSHEILVLLLRLRQVCCHCGLIAAMLEHGEEGGVVDQAGPDLLEELNKLTLDDARDKRKSNDKKEDEPVEESTTAAEAIRSVLSPNNPVFELERQSSKIAAVMDCLNKNVFPNKGEKAVVVSQWTSVLSLVGAALSSSGRRCATLSGAVPVPARAALVREVNDPASDLSVMLLSLCAGGVGLNLCGANHLLLLDPHWNPQLEEQAQDRIYRVGQTRHVHIYRFMCVGTVEQTIRQLQDVKLKMADSILTGARNTNASKLTIEDLKMLFNMGPQPDS